MILVVTSRDCAGRWILMAADGGCWIDRVGRLSAESAECAAVVVMTGDCALVAETVATTAGGIVLEVLTGGRDWIGW